jgi:hypothetical protein
MSMKSIVSSLLLVGVAAYASTAATDRRDFKELAARTAMSDEVSKPGAKCPISKALVDTLDLDVLAICAHYGLTAMEAARRDPAVVIKVFALYGEDPMFRSAFERYGHMVVPVVGYFVENGSNRYRVTAAVHGAIQQASQGRMPTWGDAPSGEQMGYMAVQEFDERGAELLAEFEIVDGHAKRKSIEATVLGTKNLFLGGIQKLETVLTRGESPTWKDYGGAALDVAVVAGGIGLLAKEARVAEVAAGRTSPRIVAVDAAAVLRNVGAIAVGPVGNAALLYVVLTHPMLVASAVGWSAEQLGLNGPACVFFAYLLLFQLLWWFSRPLRWCVWQSVHLAIRFYSRRLSAAGTAVS